MNNGRAAFRARCADRIINNTARAIATALLNPLLDRPAAISLGFVHVLGYKGWSSAGEACLREGVATLHGLDARGPESRRVVVDPDGAMLGPDCVLVRRTPTDYRCMSLDEATSVHNVLKHQFEGPDWLFRQCCRIAKALADGHLSVAQIYGLFIRTQPLDDTQIEQLAALAPVVKANFNPDEPRDAHGRWADEGEPNRQSVKPTGQEQASLTPQERHRLCVDQCYHILLRSRPYRWSDLNTYAFRRCYNDCMRHLE